MSDTVTARERALIDAAVAGGGVTRVPSGASGLPEYRWSEKDKALRYEKGVGKRLRFSGQRPRFNDKVAARRENVAKMTAAGKRPREIAEIFDVSIDTIYTDLQRQGIAPAKPEPKEPRPPAEPRSRQSPEVAARRARVAEMARNGLICRQIAANLNVPMTTVYFDVRKLGIRLFNAGGGHATGR